MRRWIARFAFSFMMVGVWLLWEGFKTRPGPWGATEITTTRKAAYVIGGALCLGIGLAGVRDRHRPS